MVIGVLFHCLTVFIETDQNATQTFNHIRKALRMLCDDKRDVSLLVSNLSNKNIVVLKDK